MTSEAGRDEAAAGDRTAASHWGNPYLLLALASLFWSGNHILGRAIGGHVPPIGISTMHWLIPALTLWPFARGQFEIPRLLQFNAGDLIVIVNMHFGHQAQRHRIVAADLLRIDIDTLPRRRTPTQVPPYLRRGRVAINGIVSAV